MLQRYLRPLLALFAALLLLSTTVAFRHQIKSGGLPVLLLLLALLPAAGAALLVAGLGLAKARALSRSAAAGIRHIPRPVRYLVAVVLLFQLLCLALATERYPFSDVGMFRGGGRLTDLDPEVEVPKFYFRQAGTDRVVVVDLRREHLFFLQRFPRVSADQLFSVRPYDNMHRERNYRYVRQLMAPYAQDLQLGIHQYNFRTGRDTFYTDPAVVTDRLQRHGQRQAIYIP